MKIKILNPLIIVDILVIILVASTFDFHSNILQIALGIPFILLFPGYALVKFIFAKKEAMDKLEALALSAGTSIAMVGLIGFGLNYTHWGIKAEPVVAVVAALTILLSIAAMVRRTVFQKRADIIADLNLVLPHWEGSALNKSFSIILIILILCAGSALGYTITLNKNTERFTEFYVLGHTGKAQDYPAVFIMQDTKVTSVLYGTGTYQDNNQWGEVTLDVVSHEKQSEDYTIKMLIDGLPAQMLYNGNAVDNVDIKALLPGKTWEQTIGFAPTNLGDNQLVQFVLYKGSAATPTDTLQLSFNAAKTLLDFYLLGLNGQAQDVPVALTVQNGQLTGVEYSGGEFVTVDGWADITLGIVNHSTQSLNFSIQITMGGLATDIMYNNQMVGQIRAITLESGAKWEQEIGFTPPLGGDNLKVDFLLFQGNATEPAASLELIMSAHFN